MPRDLFGSHVDFHCPDHGGTADPDKGEVTSDHDLSSPTIARGVTDMFTGKTAEVGTTAPTAHSLRPGILARYPNSDDGGTCSHP